MNNGGLTYHQEGKIGLTAVSYHNTKPFLYGLENGPLRNQLDIHLDIPAVGAQRLLDGELQLGLIPVAVLNALPKASIVSQFCIGAKGAVKTVCLFSDQPIEYLDAVYLDYHSRTSVQLLQVLFREHWKVAPTLLKAEAGFREKIGGSTGGLIIGDRAIGMEDRFNYCYDLSEEWFRMTGLPFVFAAWVATKQLPADFLQEFNLSLGVGVSSIDKVARQHQANAPAGFDLQTYLTENISFDLDQDKMRALGLFLEMIGHREPSFQLA